MGFQYVGTEDQGDVTGKVKTFAVDAAHSTILAAGDVVKVTGTGTAAGKSAVDTGTANAANTGVVTSIIPNYSGEALSQTWLPASTAGQVIVNVDPYAIYEVDVANGPLAAADVGLNVPLVATAATVSGALPTSNMKVNATGKATTATLPFRVIELLEDSSGTLGNRARVRVNASTSNIGATGV